MTSPGYEASRRVCALLVAASTAAILCAERLPFKSYTRADGLATGQIRQIVTDSRGFLWFAAQGGITFFDGYRFHTYDLENTRLPFPSTNDFLETGGYYWIATNGFGVWRFEPTRSSLAADSVVRFTVGDSAATNRVNTLFHDQAGALWAGTDGGVFRMDRGEDRFHRVPLHIVQHTEDQMQTWCFLADPDGSLWIGTKFGLIRMLADGKTVHYPIHPGQPTDVVFVLLRDGQSRLWIGHRDGFQIFHPEPATGVHASLQVTERRKIGAVERTRAILPAREGQVESYAIVSAAGQDAVTALHQTKAGDVWIGTLRNGLFHYDGQWFSHYGSGEGLETPSVTILAEDSGGHLWIGARGATQLSRNGFVSYGPMDGVPEDNVAAFGEDSAGHLYFTQLRWTISRLDEDRWTTVRLNVPTDLLRSGIEICRTSLLDHRGDWWIGSRVGLLRYSGVKRLEDLAVRKPQIFRAGDGLAENDIQTLFEDSRGDVWIGYFGTPARPLTRWDRASGRFQHYSPGDGLRSGDTVIAIAEDTARKVWIGYRGSGLAVYRSGRFEEIPMPNGAEPGGIVSLYRDHAGRIWAGSQRIGLIRIDHPAADRPAARTYTIAEGISGNAVRGISEDRLGRIYAITGRGVNRLDPESGRISLYRDSDGLSGFDVQIAYTDSRGRLWFGSDRGPLRLSRTDEHASAPPAVFIGGLRVGGFPYAIPDMGAPQVNGVKLASGERQLHIEYFALGFGGGQPLRYQYKLGGGGGVDWSAPSEQTSVDFANLAPGRYEFAVRAVNADGAISIAPATVGFSVPAPVWRQWWAITIFAGLVSLAIYAIHRNRLARLLELERVRTRIATDLHDDVGSTLSQISVLSEVVQQHAYRDSIVTEPLSQITGLSRDLVDSLNDIVWAINPKRDSLSDTTHRMRRFASDLLSARNLDFAFRGPASREELRMGADLRREVYLIFKETIHNVVRHAECSRVEIALTVEHGWLDLQVRDDGRGFESNEGNGGNGLASMRQRASRIGGNLSITSVRGKGTEVHLRAPIGRRVYELR